MGEPTTPNPLHALLGRLSARARRLLLAQGLAGFVLGGSVAAVGAAVSLSLSGSRALATGLAAVGLLGGLGALVAAVAGRRFRSAGQAVVQARRVEALRPELRGGLLAAIEAPDQEGAKPAPRGVSVVLLERARRRVAATVAEVSPKEVHSARPAQIAAGVAVAALVGVLAAERLPVGPTDAVGILLGRRSMAAVKMEAAATNLAEERAVVGDIVLRYVFPDYTGLDPIEVPNSDGTIHAPVGTVVQITARTAEPFDSAAIQLLEADPRDVTLAGGRDLATELTVEGAGVWRFLLFSGEQVTLSPDYRIEVEQDGAPVVSLQGEGAAAQPRDRRIQLQWSAQDDFGIERVALEVVRADGTVEEHTLRTPLDAAMELEGGVPLSPDALGIPAGESVKLRVVAYDNDQLEGSKRGVSTEVEMKVVGPKGYGQMLTAHYKRLRDALVDSVAGFLVEPVPPAESRADMIAWVSTARERITPVRELQEAQWRGHEATGIDAQVLSSVFESSGELFRFVLTTWEPGSNRRVTNGDLESFAALHAELIEAEERAIVVLDQLVVQTARAQVAQAVEDLAQQAQQLAAMAEDAEAGELLARLDQLERMLQSVSQMVSELSEGSLKEFLNPRLDELKSLSDEIREAIAEGRMDDAREMLQQLAQQLQEMSESANGQMSGQQEQEDQLQQQFEQTQADLEELQEQQEELADELEEAREEMGDSLDELMELWARLDTLSEEALTEAGAVVTRVGDGQGWLIDSIRRFEGLKEAVTGVRDAVRARNAEAALERVTSPRTRRAVGMSGRQLRAELDRPRMNGEAAPPAINDNLRSVQAVDDKLEEMEELLLKLLDQQEQESPQTQAKAQELASKQRELDQRQEQVAKDVQRIERAMPTSDGSASDAMESADRAMDQATEALENGEAMAGEGHGRDAAARLQEAQDALQQQMNQYQQMQQAMQQAQGQQPNQPDDGEGSSSQSQTLEIPAPEAFQTPEEYRRALLEGMEGEVPDGFEEFKQRYYEELVRQ